MKHCFYAVLVAALFVSCVNEELENRVAAASPEETAAADGAFVPGEAYVCFSEGLTELIEADLAAGSVRTKSSELNSALDALGITEMSRVFPHAGEYEPRTRREGLHRWYFVRYSADMPRTKAEDAFRNVEGVEIIEPVRQIKINDFDDTRYKDLWALDNSAYPEYDINVLPVWDNYTTGNPNVIVAVIDSGVDLKHEDLSANCLPADKHIDAMVPDNNWKDNDFPGGGLNLSPDSHGTHVAGTIAAVGNNGKGVAGIAGGDYKNGKQGVKIMSCQIFYDNVGNYSAAAVAMKWAADNGAVISQNSWGHVYDTDGDKKLSPEEKRVADADEATELQKAAIDYFIKYAGCDNDGNQLPDSPMKGGVVIFAAGNDGYTNGAPGNYENVIAVGAINSKGERTDFSNYGSWVDICAPGEGIWSTVPGGYEEKHGTSMACPHVSGVAALIVSHFGRQGFTADMLKEALLNGVNKDIPADRIGGLVNAYDSFRYIDSKDVEYVNPVSDLTAAGRLNNIDLSWTTVKDSEDGAAYGYMILYGENRADVEAATAADHSKVKVLTYEPGTAAGKKVKYSITKVKFETEYFVKVLAYSFGGLKYSEATEVLPAVTTANGAPEIATSYTGSYDVKASQTLTIPFTVSDPDGHNITVTYEKGSEADSFRNVPGSGWQLTIVGNADEEGAYTGKITVTDEYGLASVKEVKYKILPNNAPVKLKEIENIMLPARGKEIALDMSEYVNDPDGDELRFDIAISNPKVFHMVVKKGKILGVALGYGTVDVQIKAKDAKGLAVTFAFKIQIKDPLSPISVYPTQVTDFVTIGTLDPAETQIRIVSQTGKTVYDQTSTVSGYEPARIDMTSCPPGLYIVNVAFGGKEYKQNIVKL